LIFLLAGLVVVWITTAIVFSTFKHSQVTAEKVEQHIQQVDLAKLGPSGRGEALHQLMDEVNALSTEERQKYRQDGRWRPLFDKMNDEEKSVFIEGTLPSGFKQILTSFEKLSPEKRKQTIEETMARLKKTSDPTSPPLSPSLQQDVVRVGLNAYFTQSSPQAKAELAPLLEEMQHQMMKGNLFRGDR
jgi:hypothetical protein